MLYANQVCIGLQTLFCQRDWLRVYRTYMYVIIYLCGVGRLLKKNYHFTMSFDELFLLLQFFRLIICVFFFYSYRIMRIKQSTVLSRDTYDDNNGIIAKMHNLTVCTVVRDSHACKNKLREPSSTPINSLFCCLEPAICDQCLKSFTRHTL